MDLGITARISRVVAEADTSAVSTQVAQAASRSLINALGCIVAGASHPTTALLAKTLAGHATEHSVRPIGRTESGDITFAAAVNATAGSVHTYDDTHSVALVHPSAIVAAALLSIAASRPLDGRSFTAAYALGVEAVGRLSTAISVPPAVAVDAFVQTSLCGPIGVAIAVSKVLNLGAEQVASAIAIAASQAGGLRVDAGLPAMSVKIGFAAQAGSRAALLAAAGLEASQTSLETRHGFAEAFSRGHSLEDCFAGYGSDFEFGRNIIKAYPAGAVIQASVAACLKAAAGAVIPANSIARVRVRAHPWALKVGGQKHPKDAGAAQLSLSHWVSVALALGHSGLEALENKVLQDPDIVALRDRVVVAADPAFERDAAMVEAELSDGRVLASGLVYCRGGPDRPMADEELERKFRNLCLPWLETASCDQALAMCWQVSELAEVSQLLKILARGDKRLKQTDGMR